MPEEVKEKMGDKKEDLQPKNSLSIDGWTTIVSAEINRINEEIFQSLSIFFIAVSIFIAICVYVFTEYDFITTIIFSIIMLIILGYFYWKNLHEMNIMTKELKPKIEDIRDYIISTESPDPKEIRKRWEDYKALLNPKH